jgi:hypothetical protein
MRERRVSIDRGIVKMHVRIDDASAGRLMRVVPRLLRPAWKARNILTSDGIYCSEVVIASRKDVNWGKLSPGGRHGKAYVRKGSV